MSAPSYLSLLSTVVYNQVGSTISDGSVPTVSLGKQVWGYTFPSSLNFSTFTGSTLTMQTATVGSTLSVASTITASTMVLSGNVGIGTNNPLYKLDVINGNARIGNTTTNSVITGNYIQITSPNAALNSYNAGYPPDINTIVRNSIGAYFGVRDGVVSRGAAIDFEDVGIRPDFPTAIRGGRIRFYTVPIVNPGTDAYLRMTLDSDGNLTVAGGITGASKSFKINHPLFPESNKKKLIHASVEGPRMDLLYRGSVSLYEGKATVNMDTDSTSKPECAMTSGTFEVLCRNPVFYLQNMTGFARIKGQIQGAVLTILCEDPACTDTVSWLVVAERNDPFVIQTGQTTKDGYLITEIEDVE